jgi:hypothetical protein
MQRSSVDLAERHRDDEVRQPGDQDRRHADVLVERVAPELRQLARRQRHAEQVDQRRVLGQQHELVRQRRQDDPERLRDHDRDHRAPLRHAERARGLHLPLRHRLDARAESLRHVRRGDEPERDRDRAEDAARQLGVERDRDAVAEADQHEQRRHAAEELDVDGGEHTVGRHGREPHQRDHEPEHEAERERAERVQDGVLERDGDHLGEQLPDHVDVEERVADALPVGQQREQEHGQGEQRVLRGAERARPLPAREPPAYCGSVPNHFLYSLS